MKEAQATFLAILGKPPARLTAEQAGWVLNFAAHDIPLLVAAGLLKPLGKPQPNAVKYFATSELLEKAADPKWLSQATATVSKHWQRKNAGKRAQVSTTETLDHAPSSEEAA